MDLNGWRETNFMSHSRGTFSATACLDKAESLDFSFISYRYSSPKHLLAKPWSIYSPMLYTDCM